MALSLCNTTTDASGRELVEHGTALFPIACYHDDLAREPVPWHWHDELEAAIITEGAAIVAMGTQQYTIHQGSGFFINRGVLHGAWNVDTSACRFHSLVFHPRLVGGSIDSIFWQKYIEPLLAHPTEKSFLLDPSVDWHKEAIDSIETAWQKCRLEEPEYEFQIRTSLSRLIYLLCNHLPVTPTTPSHQSLRDAERIKTMLQYIHDHYADEVSLSQISRHAMVSESECLRCFQKNIGTSPIQYVKQYRIQKASELLTATDQKISDIGVLCGFQDISYFIKTFKKRKGCTPSEYRKEKGMES